MDSGHESPAHLKPFSAPADREHIESALRAAVDSRLRGHAIPKEVRSKVAAWVYQAMFKFDTMESPDVKVVADIARVLLDELAPPGTPIPEFLGVASAVGDAMDEIIRDVLTFSAAWKGRERTERGLSKQQVGSAIAHELRNRLGAAETALQVLAQSSDALGSERRAKIVSIIKGSLESAVESVSVIPHLTGTNDPQSPVEGSPAERVIRRTVEELVPIAEGRLVTIEVGALTGSPVPTHLTRLVVSNLLGNAIKYSDPAKSQHWVRVEVVDEDAWIIIRVTDNGVGIPENKLNSVFHPAVQLDDKRTGWGMGLAIVRRALRSVDGQVSVESEWGEGSSFTARIPRNWKETA